MQESTANTFCVCGWLAFSRLRIWSWYEDTNSTLYSAAMTTFRSKILHFLLRQRAASEVSLKTGVMFAFLAVAFWTIWSVITNSIHSVVNGPKNRQALVSKFQAFIWWLGTEEERRWAGPASTRHRWARSPRGGRCAKEGQRLRNDRVNTRERN